MGDDGLSINGPSTFRGAVLMLVIGLVATGYGAYDYTQQSDAVADAVEVNAEIAELGVESTSAGSSTGVDYRPTVRFTYEYEETRYTSTNVFPSTISRITTPNRRLVLSSMNIQSTSRLLPTLTRQIPEPRF